MQNQLTRAINLDLIGISISVFCVFHCLVLPIILSFLPVFSAGGGHEWIHKLLVLVALPISGIAMVKSFGKGVHGLIVVILLTIGLMLLLASTLVSESLEIKWTLGGALALILGHVMRWRLHQN